MALQFPLPTFLLQHNALRFEVDAQGVQPRSALIQRLLHVGLPGFPGGLFRFPGGLLFFNARRWASNSACRAASCSASVDWEVKASSRCNSHWRRSSANADCADWTSARNCCSSASRAACLSAISVFCASQAACCSSSAWRWAIQLGLPGRQLFGFRGLGSQVRRRAATPTGAVRRPRRLVPTGLPRKAAAVRPRVPHALRQFPPFAVPRRPAALPASDAGHPTRPAGPPVVRLPWIGKPRLHPAATPTGDVRRPRRFARIRLPQKPLQFGLVRACLSAVSVFCVSQAACCSSSA